MSETYGQIWRTVRNHVPQLPVSLAQYFVQNAFEDVCRAKAWSFLRGEAELLTNDYKTGTCNVTRSSATVSGGTLSYATTDAGRQFRVGANQPIYTISTATASSYTLDRVYGGTSATATTASVLDAYMTMPADFQRFICVLDTVNNWQLRIFMTEDELNTWDAQRSATGTPWGLFSRRLSTYTSTTGQVQYELWPYTTVAKNYPYFYIKLPTPFTQDSDLLPLILPGNILINKALAQAHAWPGPNPDKKVSTYDLNLANLKDRLVQEDLERVEVRDEDIYLTWWETVSWINRFPMAPLDAKFRQNHDLPGQVWAP